MPLYRQLYWCALGALGLLAVATLSGCASSAQHATEMALQAGEAGPRDSNAALINAEVALERKDYLQAAQLLAAVAAASDDEQVAERATAVAFEHKQNGYALQSATRWLELNSSSERARRYAGFTALRLYRIDLAAEHFQALLESNFISPQAGFMALVGPWFEEGSRPAVLALMQRLIVKNDNAAEAHYVLGQAALQAENLKLAMTSAQRAVELSPYWSPAKSLLARVQLAHGQNDAALATAKAVVEQDAKVESRLEFAQLQYAAGQGDEARKALEELSTDAELGSVAERSLALIDLDLGQTDSAVKRWRGLVQRGRFVYEGLYQLAQVAERRGETGDAIELYSRVTAGDYVVPAQTRAAVLKARAGSVDDGMALLKAFADANPDYALDILTSQASLLAEFDRVDEGVKVLDGAIARYPEHDALRVAKALMLERHKRTSDALAEMRQLYRERPEDPTVLNMLGYTLVDRTRNVDEGLKMIERALAAMPDNGAVLDSMGWALHRARRSQEALPYLQRAHERARDPEIAVHLGEVLWTLGDAAQAREVWQKELDAHPDNAELAELLRKRKAK